jgi:hypothetical protein
MARPAPLPLASDQLPQSIRRFCDVNAPGPARMMAARGMVPVKGEEQVMILLQLSADPDPALAQAATGSLHKLPEAVLLPACSTDLGASFLDRLAELFLIRDDVLELVVANARTDSASIEWIALRCSEKVSERIAVNEQRLLGTPSIIEALYKNKNTRMSTADRLIELAARNNRVLDLPVFQAHVEAIRGQLIPEPSEEPLPSDIAFSQALAEDSSSPDILENVGEDEEAEEQVKEKFLPLMMRIRTMTSAEKMRLALVGSAGARALLVRDKNKTVSYAAITSPAIGENEIPAIARSKEVSEEILRTIGNNRTWTKSHEIKIALVFNPRCPVGISLRFVSHLRDNELKELSRSRNVAQPLKSAAMQRIQMKEKKERGGK